MGVYLDVDADILFAPRNNGGAASNQFAWISPDDLVNHLKVAGLDWSESVLSAFTDHKEAYFVWKDLHVVDQRLVHVDSHLDCYGTFSWMLHCGNFLRRALDEHMFSEVIWVIPNWLWEQGDFLTYDSPAIPGERWTLTRRSREIRWRCRNKALIRVVRFEEFLMPSCTVTHVTFATSPGFVPGYGIRSIQRLFDLLASTCSKVEIHPSPEAWLSDFMGTQFSEDPPSKGYLWFEHRSKQNRELSSYSRIA